MQVDDGMIFLSASNDDIASQLTKHRDSLTGTGSAGKHELRSRQSSSGLRKTAEFRAAARLIFPDWCGT